MRAASLISSHSRLAEDLKGTLRLSICACECRCQGEFCVWFHWATCFIPAPGYKGQAAQGETSSTCLPLCCGCCGIIRMSVASANQDFPDTISMLVLIFVTGCLFFLTCNLWFLYWHKLEGTYDAHKMWFSTWSKHFHPQNTLSKNGQGVQDLAH